MAPIWFDETAEFAVDMLSAIFGCLKWDLGQRAAVTRLQEL
jgi:hypothetical protein